jgi:hypothetical protein
MVAPSVQRTKFKSKNGSCVGVGPVTSITVKYPVVTMVACQMKHEHVWRNGGIA